MNTVFSEWASALSDLQASVSKDLEEIRRQKAEIQKLKEDIYHRLNDGTYIRDDKRIVISAPEIVIGNADAGGMLLGETGSVVVRGINVSLEGVGNNGIVKTRATNIEQIAVDPGADGIQEAVLTNSSIVSHARSIVIQSNNSNGYFSLPPTHVGDTGIRIHADQNLEIEAAQTVENRSTVIKDLLTELNKHKTQLTKDSVAKMKAVTTLTAEMEALLTKDGLLNATDLLTYTNVLDIADDQNKAEALTPAMYKALDDSIQCLSKLAEINRRITSLKAEQEELNNVKANFKTESTKANLKLTAENIDIASKDADGNIRDNKEAAINIQTGHLRISTLKADGSLIDNSNVSIATKDVSITTANTKRKDDQNAEEPLEGSFYVRTKNTIFDSTDYSLKNGTYEEKEQTKSGNFSIRAENMSLMAYDKEGATNGQLIIGAEKISLFSTDKDANATGTFNVLAKDMDMSSVDKDKNATGTFAVKAETISAAATDKGGKVKGKVSINAKDVHVKSMDVDDKGKNTGLANGGNMVLVAENMYVGRTKKDSTSKQLQLSSDKLGLHGTSTAEMEQGSGKAIVQLDGGNLSASGSKTQFYGETTVNGKATFKADVAVPKLKADNLEAGTSFKSPNISDGIAVPGAPSTASLSAKLKEADAPE